jgi:hypothetical protein
VSGQRVDKHASEMTCSCDLSTLDSFHGPRCRHLDSRYELDGVKPAVVNEEPACTYCKIPHPLQPANHSNISRRWLGTETTVVVHAEKDETQRNESSLTAVWQSTAEEHASAHVEPQCYHVLWPGFWWLAVSRAGPGASRLRLDHGLPVRRWPQTTSHGGTVHGHAAATHSRDTLPKTMEHSISCLP